MAVDQGEVRGGSSAPLRRCGGRFGLSAITLSVEVTRGRSVESVHRAVGVVCSGTEGAESCVGDPILLTFWRSAMKPFQTLPLIEDGVVDAFGFGDEEIALASASHGGTAAHVEVVARMLEALKVDAEALHCGAHAPFDPDAAFRLRCAGIEPGRIHNNCSGKHAGMLALARHHGWDADGYWRLDHPVQKRIRDALEPWMDIDPDDHEWALDGCGVPTPRLPLREMARAYARLVRGAREGRPAAAAVVRAMTGRPDLTSSPGRAPLVLMEATGGRLLAKEGAEGVLCLASVDDDWGMAVKVEDGGLRAVGPAVVAVLEEAEMITERERSALGVLQDLPIRNTLGAEVGRIRAHVIASDAIRGRLPGSEGNTGRREPGP